jgi:hypothetical protein
VKWPPTARSRKPLKWGFLALSQRTILHKSRALLNNQKEQTRERAQSQNESSGVDLIPDLLKVLLPAGSEWPSINPKCFDLSVMTLSRQGSSWTHLRRHDLSRRSMLIPIESLQLAPIHSKEHSRTSIGFILALFHHGARQPHGCVQAFPLTRNGTSVGSRHGA